MSFADRVLSLLAADFLTCPQQYMSTPRKPISEPPPTGVHMKRPDNL